MPDLNAFFCARCNSQFAAWARSPMACPNCGVQFFVPAGGDDDSDIE